MAEQIIRVFISSTFEDFQDERASIVQTIIALNRVFGDSEIALIPVDLKSGARPYPPKEECLKEVRGSKVLVGLLGERYGTIDEETGKSISELEYDEACALEIPVLMYIRNGRILPQWIDDEPSLKTRLKTFKTKVDGAAKRDTFESSEQLRDQVFIDLSRLVLDKFYRGSSAAVLEESSRSSTSLKEEQPITRVPPGEEGTPPSVAAKGTAQVLGMIERAAKSLKAQMLFTIDEEDSLRLFVLIASVLPSQVGVMELGNHVVQRLYLNREKQDLTDSETAIIYHTVLRDTFSRKAGWFWLRSVGEKKLVKMAETLAAGANVDEATRKGAVELLETLVPNKAEPRLLGILKSCQREDQGSILDYLCANGSEKSLSAIEDMVGGQDKWLVEKAILAKIGVLSRCDGARAVEVIVEESHRNPDILTANSLEGAVRGMEAASLRRLTAEGIACALRELGRQGRATDDEYLKMTKSDDAETAYLGFAGLLERGRIIGPEEIRKTWSATQARGSWGEYARAGLRYRAGLFGSYILGTPLASSERAWQEEAIAMAYMKMPDSDLQAAIAFDRRRKDAYLAWGLRKGREVTEIVRSDLESLFLRIWNADGGKVQVPNAATGEIPASLEGGLAQEASTYCDFVAAGLKILEKHGDSSDKQIAVKYLGAKSVEVRACAISLLCKHADKSDIPTLIPLLNDARAESRLAAARRVLELDSENRCAPELLKCNQSDVVREYLLWRMTKRLTLDSGDIVPLLKEKNDDIRLLAAAYVVRTYSKKALAALLKLYQEGEMYYYDVVCWFDRILYAPKNISEGFLRRLVKRLV